MFFVDSNVLLYAIDPDDDRKRTIARNILARGQLGEMVFSAQILGEFVNVVRRKRPISLDRALAMVERWSLVIPVIPTRPDHIVAGGRIAIRYKLQYWDSLLIAVAADQGAQMLLSEDMQDGGTVEGVTILNPFRPDNSARLQALIE